MGFYGLAAACVAVLCFVSGVIGYSKGSISRNAEVAEYQAAIKASEILAREAEERNGKAEVAHEDRLKDIAANIVKENARYEADRNRAAANARALVLRNAPICPGGSGGAEAQASPGSGDGKAICELPAEIVRDMESLVLDADRDVRQLGHAQTVIEEDRKVCGPS
jgi:hypothetical protein